MHSPALQPGDAVGPYRIAALAGAGGMGEVYRAYDPRLRRQLALKVLPPSVVDNPQRVRRFTLEAQAASALNHPNILTIFEIGAIDPFFEGGAPLHYIAMELIAGETLRAHMNRKEPLETLTGWVAQTADGLDAAHAAGLVHRDLKPENVMITADGRAKILDFGLAKLVDSSAWLVGEQSATPVATSSGAVVGTLGYMSPEQVRGRPVDARSDLFSLGCILYEIAAGVRPFTGNSPFETLHKIAYEDPPPLPKPVDKKLAAVIRRCLASDFTKRYATAAELARALRAAKEQLPPVVVVERAATSWRRSLPVLAAVAIAIAAAFGVYSVANQDEETPTPEGVRPAIVKHSELTKHGKTRRVAISADGRYVAQIVERNNRDEIVLRQLSTASETVIGSEAARGINGLSIDPHADFVYYSAGVGSGSAIYRLPILGGSRELAIAGGGGPLRFSRDGTQAVYIRERGTGSDVVLRNMRNGRERLLAQSSQPAYFADVCSNADGTVAYIEGDSRTGDHHIVVVPVGGGRALWRSSKPWHWIKQLVPLPDGNFLIVGVEVSDGWLSIHHVDRAKQTFTRLTDGIKSYEDVSVTADGVTAAAVESEQPMELWTIRRYEEGESSKVSDSAGGIRGIDWWAPHKAVYASNVSGNWDLWEIDLELHSARPLTRDAAADAYPDVSPDGTKIVFSSTRAGGQRNIWILDRTTGASRRLTSGEGQNWARFSHDGSFLLYQSYASGTETVYRLDLQSMQSTVIGEGCCADVSSGGMIALLSRDGGRYRLHIGTQTMFLPGSVYPLASIRWNDSGSNVLYVDQVDDVGNVWTVYPGLGARQISRFNTGHIEGFDLSPFAYGDDILAARGSRFSDTVLLQLR